MSSGWRAHSGAILSLLLVLVSCTAPSPTPSASVATTSADASPGDTLGEAVTSEQKIADALASGEIDEETSLRFRAYALYADSRLPPEYQSEVIDIEAGMALSAEIQARNREFSDELLDEIRPFLARPNDPVSVLFAPPAAMQSRRVGADTVLASTVDAPDAGEVQAQAVAGWDSRLAAGGIARVWAFVPAGVQGDIVLSGYEQVVSDVWTHLDDLIREPNSDDGDDNPTGPNPDSAIDIYFVNYSHWDTRWEPCKQDSYAPGCRLTGNVMGMASPAAPYEDEGQGSSGYLMVQETIGGDLLKGTLGHELFHLSQFSYDYNDSLWLMEATATWAEFRILQKMKAGLGSVHDYLPAFFDNLDRSLDSTHGTHAYGAYTYFLHAQMDRGDDVVRRIWERAAAAGKQGINAVSEVMPLLESFPAFALRSWNQDPIDPRYRSADDAFPDVRPPDYGQRYAMSADMGVVRIDAVIDELAARYFHFDFPDEAVRSVTFTNTLADPEGAIQALLRLPNGWEEPQTWTNEGEVTLCRDRPDENVQELVIIISNSHATDVMFPGENPRLEAMPTCEPLPDTFVGEATYVERIGEGITFSTRITGIVFEKIDDSAGITSYALVDGRLATTWESSPLGSPCTTSASGEQPIGPDEGVLVIDSVSFDEPTYNGHASTMTTLEGTTTCDGVTAPTSLTRYSNWFPPSGNATVEYVAGEPFIRGERTREDPGQKGEEWTWNLRPGEGAPSPDPS